MEGVPVTPATTMPSKGFSIKDFKWQKKHIFYVGGAVVATYLIVHFAKQGSMLKKTCFKPAGFVPNKLSINDADINIKLKMKNKSKIDYYLKNQIYNVYINDQFVGVIRNANKLYIAPEKSSDVWLNVKFNPLKVANISWDTIKDILSKGGDAKIQLKGNARVVDKSGLFAFNYPVDSTFSLKDLTSGTTSDPC